MNTFWSLFICVVTTLTTIALVWLLVATARKRVGDRGDDDTTGHVWDGDLVELNKPLPRWWFGLFVLTVVFGVGYLALYPGMGAYDGALNWSSPRELDADLAATRAKLDSLFAQFRDRGIADLAADPAAVRVGRNVFVNNCAACHGSDARGAKGFPNLADGDWLYGGDADTVLASVRNGRAGVMPPLGAALAGGGVAEVANYVRKLSNQSFDAALASAGQARFETICAACHGKDGKGNTALGAPNLTDDVWLYGGSLAAIEETINYGRNGRMPAWEPLLGADRVRLVAAYVYAQSHPVATEAPAERVASNRAPPP